MKLETTRNSLERVLFDHDEEIVESPRIREIARGSYRGKGGWLCCPGSLSHNLLPGDPLLEFFEKFILYALG